MLDIETTPALVYTWGLFNQTISVDQIVRPTSVLCWAAKWRGEKKLMWRGSQKGFKGMIRRIHELLSEADAVCHYNGKSFDIPRLNQEFLLQGMKPTPPIPQIDLKEVVSRNFSMVSSKLAFVGPYLGLGEKVKHGGWDLWRGCLDGDAESWATMEEYNRQDVVLLEALYDKLLPWIEGHPNMGIGRDVVCCPNCGGTSLNRRGFTKSRTFSYVKYQCKDCGKWCQARRTDKTVKAAEVK